MDALMLEPNRTSPLLTDDDTPRCNHCGAELTTDREFCDEQCAYAGGLHDATRYAGGALHRLHPLVERVVIAAIEMPAAIAEERDRLYGLYAEPVHAGDMDAVQRITAALNFLRDYVTPWAHGHVMYAAKVLEDTMREVYHD